MHWPSLLQLDARKLPVKRAAKLLPHASVGLGETSMRRQEQKDRDFIFVRGLPLTCVCLKLGWVGAQI